MARTNWKIAQTRARFAGKLDSMFLRESDLKRPPPSGEEPNGAASNSHRILHCAAPAPNLYQHSAPSRARSQRGDTLSRSRPRERNRGCISPRIRTFFLPPSLGWPTSLSLCTQRHIKVGPLLLSAHDPQEEKAPRTTETSKHVSTRTHGADDNGGRSRGPSGGASRRVFRGRIRPVASSRHRFPSRFRSRRICSAAARRGYRPSSGGDDSHSRSSGGGGGPDHAVRRRDVALAPGPAARSGRRGASRGNSSASTPPSSSHGGRTGTRRNAGVRTPAHPWPSRRRRPAHAGRLGRGAGAHAAAQGPPEAAHQQRQEEPAVQQRRGEKENLLFLMRVFFFGLSSLLLSLCPPPREY